VTPCRTGTTASSGGEAERIGHGRSLLYSGGRDDPGTHPVRPVRPRGFDPVLRGPGKGVLAREGLIQRKQGKGTLVSRSKTDEITFELSGSFQRHVDALGRIPFDVDVLDVATLPCPTEIQSVLGIPSRQNVLRVRKIRKHRGVPVAYYVHYTSPALCRGMRKRDLERFNFPDVIRKSSTVTLARMEQTLKATVADLDVSKVLGIKFGLPLFFMENVYISTEDKPAILTQIYYRGDMCSYRSTLQL
jgi:GntR family transcriptional regulator